jgi:hypothetical protein
MTLGDVGLSARHFLKRGIWPIVTGVCVCFAVLIFTGHPGAPAFALIAIGNLILLAMWSNNGQGLPLIPVLGIQNLVAYGLPLLTKNENVMGYPPEYMFKAGQEMLIFSLTLAITWRIGMQVIPTHSKLCYALQGFDSASPKLGRLGLGMVIGSSLYHLLHSAGALDSILAMLPAGMESIENAFISAISASGFFLTAMMIGRGAIRGIGRSIFWVLLWLQCFISASGFLLSATTTVLFSAGIGLFWGGGKIPWRLIGISAAMLAFLNLGKFTMRERYWRTAEEGGAPTFGITEMPHYYTEWIGASVDAITGAPVTSSKRDAFSQLKQQDDSQQSGQSLLDRINNLQNLLFVIDAMESNHVPPLGGASYAVIPPLLIPRVIWGGNKPRSHEGQVRLNVHFGRQDLNSTFSTYIAWGLLPEAYGNFGPATGAIILGGVLGFFAAWVERFGARKLVLSLEGFLSFTLFLGIANSFEMVASVLVTSIFQAFVPTILASLPFVEQILPKEQNTPSTPPE